MTILIVGGAAQGKSAFARRISPETEIVDNLQDIVREAMQEGKSIPKAEAFRGKTVQRAGLRRGAYGRHGTGLAGAYRTAVL